MGSMAVVRCRCLVRFRILLFLHHRTLALRRRQLTRAPVVVVPRPAAIIAVAAAVAAAAVVAAAVVPAVVVAPRHRAARQNRLPIAGVRHGPDHHQLPVQRPRSRRQPAPGRSVRSYTRCVRCSGVWNRSSSSTMTS
uniref:Putative secreted peptide n=1 Tax=Anopheles braziliensis TaxID=58242 RepID=A0A2M3ZNC1_9DIPT